MGMGDRSDFIRDRQLHNALAASNHCTARKIANEMTQQGLLLLVGLGADPHSHDGNDPTSVVHVAVTDFLLMTNHYLELILCHATSAIRDDCIVFGLGPLDLDRHPPEEMQEAPDGR